MITDRLLSVILDYAAAWRREAADLDSEGYFCCALTRLHDAELLEAALRSVGCKIPKREASDECINQGQQGNTGPRRRESS